MTKRLLSALCGIGILLSASSLSTAQPPASQAAERVSLENIPAQLAEADESKHVKVTALLEVIRAEAVAKRLSESEANNIRSFARRIDTPINRDAKTLLSSARLPAGNEAVLRAATELEEAASAGQLKREALISQGLIELRERGHELLQHARTPNDVEPFIALIRRLQADAETHPHSAPSDVAIKTYRTYAGMFTIVSDILGAEARNDAGALRSPLSRLKSQSTYVGSVSFAADLIGLAERIVIEPKAALENAQLTLETALAERKPAGEVREALDRYMEKSDAMRSIAWELGPREDTINMYAEMVAAALGGASAHEVRENAGAARYKIESLARKATPSDVERYAKLTGMLNRWMSEAEESAAQRSSETETRIVKQVRDAGAPVDLDALAFELECRLANARDARRDTSEQESKLEVALGPLPGEFRVLALAWKTGSLVRHRALPRADGNEIAAAFSQEMDALRGRIERETMSRYLRAPELLQPPLSNQPSGIAIEALCERLTKKGDWKRVLKLLETENLMTSDAPPPATRQQAIAAVRAFLAAQNFELADQWEDATAAYKAVIESAADGCSGQRSYRAIESIKEKECSISAMKNRLFFLLFLGCSFAPIESRAIDPIQVGPFTLSPPGAPGDQITLGQVSISAPLASGSVDAITNQMEAAGKPVRAQVEAFLAVVDSEAAAGRITDLDARELRWTAENLEPPQSANTESLLSSTQLPAQNEAIISAMKSLNDVASAARRSRAVLATQAIADLRRRHEEILSHPENTEQLSSLLQLLTRLDYDARRHSQPGTPASLTSAFSDGAEFFTALSIAIEASHSNDEEVIEAGISQLEKAGLPKRQNAFFFDYTRKISNEIRTIHSQLRTTVENAQRALETAMIERKRATEVSAAMTRLEQAIHSFSPWGIELKLTTYRRLAAIASAMESRNTDGLGRSIAEARRFMPASQLPAPVQASFQTLLAQWERELEGVPEKASRQEPLGVRIARVKNPADLDVLAAEVERSEVHERAFGAAQVSAEAPKVASLHPILARLAVAWSTGNPDFLTRSNGFRQEASFAEIPNELIALRSRIEREVLSRFLGAHELIESPLAEKPINEALDFFTDGLALKGEWRRVLAVQDIRSNPMVYSDIRRPAVETVASIRSFLAGQNFELAGQWADAAQAYKAVIFTGADRAPLQESIERLKALKREHSAALTVPSPAAGLPSQ